MYGCGCCVCNLASVHMCVRVRVCVYICIRMFECVRTIPSLSLKPPSAMNTGGFPAKFIKLYSSMYRESKESSVTLQEAR